MKLNQLQELQELRGLNGLSPLVKEPRPIKNKYFSSVDIICYSANLCYIASKVIHDEIKVKNPNQVINDLMQEVKRTFEDDFIHELYTPTITKKFYKSIGVKPRYQK